MLIIEFNLRNICNKLINQNFFKILTILRGQTVLKQSLFKNNLQTGAI